MACPARQPKPSNRVHDDRRAGPGGTRSLRAGARQWYDQDAMAALSVHLVAIIAPGSVEADIGRVQEAILEVHGFLSAAALPPMVPVAFLDRFPAPRGFLRDLERSARAP